MAILIATMDILLIILMMVMYFWVREDASRGKRAAMQAAGRRCQWSRAQRTETFVSAAKKERHSRFPRNSLQLGKMLLSFGGTSPHMSDTIVWKVLARGCILIIDGRKGSSYGTALAACEVDSSQD